jgi:hypothetical protein
MALIPLLGEEECREILLLSCLVFFDALGTPKCEEGEVNCKRVSERRKKKHNQKQNQVVN